MKKADRLARLKRTAGQGVSTKLVDRAFWLPLIDDPEYRPWYQALEAIDKAHGAEAMRQAQRALCALLGGPIPEGVGPLLADLLARYRLTRRTGRPANPAYELTYPQAELHWAHETMRDYMTFGMKAELAAHKAVVKHPAVTEPALLRYHKGRHGGARRHKAKLRRS
jgi:hypothetical protein